MWLLNTPKRQSLRDYILVALFLLVLLLPTVAIVIQFHPPYFTPALINMALAIFLLPALFLPARIWLFIWGLFLLLLPIDLATWFSMHQPITQGFIMSILHTNKAEATEQLNQYLIPLIAYLLLLATYFIVLFKYVPHKFWLPRRVRLFFAYSLHISQHAIDTDYYNRKFRRTPRV